MLTFRRARASLGLTSFGMGIIELPPNTTQYPEHDHASDGIGGRLFGTPGKAYEPQ